MAKRRSLKNNSADANPPAGDDSRRGDAPFFERITREDGSDARALKMLFGDDPRGYDHAERQPRTEAGRRAKKASAAEDDPAADDAS